MASALTFFAALAVPSPSSTKVLQPVVAKPVPSFIGGCASYAPRASYTHIGTDASQVCDASTPGRLCGETGTTARFPSGMELPRHNVPQYLGNAVWDGLARDSTGRLIAGLLGDPFAFVVAPEMDALRRLLMDASLTPAGLRAQMERAWSIDVRYESSFNSNGTMLNFMNALSGAEGRGPGLTREFILNSSAWRQLGPASVKRRIERAITGAAPLSPEAAMCAAAHMMDSMFELRGRVAIMNDLPSAAYDMVQDTRSE